MNTFEMQIEMDGLIQILAENLYADPNIFIREMIQNAHDAIIKRELQTKKHSFNAAINVHIEPDAHTLTFTDNGAGLTLEEIHRYLSTIGGSDKRSLQLHANQKNEQNHQQVKEIIGQFGIGLLSSFIVSHQVQLLTRASQNPAFLWCNTGGSAYQVEESKRTHIGTTVTLFLKKEHQRYLNERYLSELICHYADFIGIPIFINDHQHAINRVSAPWHQGHEEKQHHHYWKIRFPEDTIIALLPLDISGTPKFPHHIHGTLAITTQTLMNLQQQGVVDVFISGMFIASGMRALLPQWAGFVHAIIETPALTPNAARDNIMPTKTLYWVRESLGKIILTWLKQLAKNQPLKWREVMRHHATHLLVMSLQPEAKELFQTIMYLLPLESNSGITTLEEYLQHAPIDQQGVQTIYYFNDASTCNQQLMLADTEKKQVINGSSKLVREFLYQFTALHQHHIRLQKTNTDMQHPLKTVSDVDTQRFQHLKEKCNTLFPVQTTIAQFEPKDVPFLILESEKSEALQELEILNNSPALSKHIRKMMEQILEEKQSTTKLHLNISNPLVQKLATLIHTSPHVSEQALALLYNNALMLYARRIKPSQIKTVFQQSSYTVDLLLDASVLLQQQHEEIQALESRIECLTGLQKNTKTQHLM